MVAAALFISLLLSSTVSMAPSPLVNSRFCVFSPLDSPFFPYSPDRRDMSVLSINKRCFPSIFCFPLANTVRVSLHPSQSFVFFLRCLFLAHINALFNQSSNYPPSLSFCRVIPLRNPPSPHFTSSLNVLLPRIGLMFLFSCSGPYILHQAIPSFPVPPSCALFS